MRLITDLSLCCCIGHMNATNYHTDGNVSGDVPGRTEAHAAEPLTIFSPMVYVRMLTITPTAP